MTTTDALTAFILLKNLGTATVLEVVMSVLMWAGIIRPIRTAVEVNEELNILRNEMAADHPRLNEGEYRIRKTSLEIVRLFCRVTWITFTAMALAWTVSMFIPPPIRGQGRSLSTAGALVIAAGIVTLVTPQVGIWLATKKSNETRAWFREYTVARKRLQENIRRRLNKTPQEEEST